MNKEFYVYILANGKYGTLYTGFTNNLLKRLYEHKEKLIKGFSKKYSVDQLVYYEIHEDVNEAILREKQIKKWNRDWKIWLIEEQNPYWNDLYYLLIGSKK